jgi:hypothetical protein
MSEHVEMRVHGNAALPVLIYLPGLHGDWTLVSSFRAAVAGRVHFVEFTYPRSLTWALEDYAKAIEAALLDRGIRSGWLLAESFGSLVGWEIVGRANRAAESPGPTGSPGFEPLGLVLAGGFVRHPLPWGVRLVRWVGLHTPHRSYHAVLECYVWWLKGRHRDEPEALASLSEFVERRTELDRLAMRRRLELIAASDARPIARQTTLPVYHLGGVLDPVVPWLGVRSWLRRHCPGYRGSKTCWRADHAVLATGTHQSAEALLAWMQAATSPTPNREGRTGHAVSVLQSLGILRGRED